MSRIQFTNQRGIFRVGVGVGGVGGGGSNAFKTKVRGIN